MDRDEFERVFLNRWVGSDDQPGTNEGPWPGIEWQDPAEGIGAANAREREAYTFYGSTAGAGRTYMGFDGARTDDEPVFARDLGEHVHVDTPRGRRLLPVAPTYDEYDRDYLRTTTVHAITTLPHPRSAEVPYIAHAAM